MLIKIVENLQKELTDLFNEDAEYIAQIVFLAMSEAFPEDGDRHLRGQFSRFKGYIEQYNFSTGADKEQSLKILEHMLNILKTKVLPVMADLSSLHNLKTVWGTQLHQFTEGISDTRNSDEVVTETLQGLKSDMLGTYNM